MPTSSSLTARDLVPHLALASHRFPDWEAGIEGERGFGPDELLERLAELGEILGGIASALGSADVIVDHMQELYLWVRGKSRPKAAPEFTARERILVLLFDAYVTEGGARTIPQLAARTGVGPDAVKAHLGDLRRMHVVETLPGGGWGYRPT